MKDRKRSFKSTHTPAPRAHSLTHVPHYKRPGMSSIQIAEKKERMAENRIESRTDCGGEINPTAPASKKKNNIIKCKNIKKKQNNN